MDDELRMLYTIEICSTKTVARRRRVIVGGGGPCVSRRPVTAAGTEHSAVGVEAAPDDHFLARPDGGLELPRSGSIYQRRRTPRVGDRIVTSAVVRGAAASPTPDDHLVTRPNA